MRFPGLLAGLVGQFPDRRLRQVLRQRIPGAGSPAGPHETAGQRPLARVGMDPALHEQYVQATIPDRQRDDIDGDRDRVVTARVVGRQEVL